MGRKDRDSSETKPTGRHADAHLMKSDLDWKEWWHQRLKGWRANHTRAVICELAYDHGVPPTAANIYRVCKTQLALHKLAGNFDLDAHTFDPDLKQLYEESRDSILATNWSVPSGPNKWGRLLNADRPPAKDTWTQIKIISENAIILGEDPFWTTYKELPTRRIAYDSYCEYLHELFPTHPECFRPGRIGEIQPPPLKLISREFEADNLRSLRFFLLLMGAANGGDPDYDGWPEHYTHAFDRVVVILSRLSCIPPFRSFGEEFAFDVMELATDDPELSVPYDWRAATLRRRSEYTKLIDIAYERQVLVKDAQSPQGQRWQELELLRFADAERFEPVRAALNAHSPGIREPLLCKKFLQSLKRKQPRAPPSVQHKHGVQS